ncbi:hypothetical protein LIER_41735 [Lithospermum erythrorhizon]|uniref:Uncharacterized protein n=1 Tax=Lithospermum erythrorhizon TaxID=34254 RepID=A0AAV3RJR3_LITER
MLNTCFDGKPTSYHTWLSFIYNFRKQWSSAWVKDAFTAGKITTHLMNHAASLFTPNVFKLIQHEYETGMTYTMKETFDVEQYTVSSYENNWLMCRHVLRAMEVYGGFGNNEFCRIVPNEFIIGR